MEDNIECSNFSSSEFQVWNWNWCIGNDEIDVDQDEDNDDVRTRLNDVKLLIPKSSA